MANNNTLVNIGYSTLTAHPQEAIAEIMLGIEEEGGFSEEYPLEGDIIISFSSSSVSIIVQGDECSLFTEEMGSQKPLLSFKIVDNGDLNAKFRLMGQNAVRYLKNKYLFTI